MVDALAVLGLVMLVPVTPSQIWKNYKSRSAAGLSWWTFTFLFLGIALFLVVSIATSAHIAITLNYAWGVAGSSAVLFQKYYYDKREASQATQSTAGDNVQTSSCEIKISPIGLVDNGVHRRADVKNWSEVLSRIVLREEMTDALAGVDEYSHAHVIYRFHKVDSDEVVTGKIVPYGLDDVSEKGILATRMRQRPNRIACALVRVVRVDGNTLTVKGLDAFHGSPVLDIKPFTGAPRDMPEEYSIPKWAEKANNAAHKL